MTHRVLVGLSVLMAFGGAGACGDSKPDTSADRAEITTLLTRHYASPACSDLTAAGRKAFGHPVDDAACTTDIATQKPKDVTVSNINVDGDNATAVAAKFTFKLVHADGHWLIDGGAR